ncbi:LysR family transcriptional regulator [Streptomyces albipurpureus]|uniref:LysR family transcriptional regulator n=1 Tax=Streptomyces albipurpureus TaxID=2897419 RepID=A0ABT0UIZ6_9ACTN|nr:LysR family transcriptional regulator [Streptomyces sp. CWNU-1]MCM2388424.1 LysR family transcriptional regulator [Streptomyces sp. CWNU-1]
MTHIRNADLNLLEALAVLLEERHVSRAAARFHLSQSAMSRTLQRLRDTFGDELLVRAGSGYEPTPRGRQIQSELADILPRLESLLRGNPFDPATAIGNFRVQCTDHATAVLGPRIFRQVCQTAPQLTLNVTPFGDHTFPDVEQGRADLAISGVTAPKSLHWETLFEEEFVCLMAADHPLVRGGGPALAVEAGAAGVGASLADPEAVGEQRAAGGRLALADFLDYRHVVVAVLGDEQTMVDRRLAELGRRRSVGLRVPFFSAAATALPGTELIATLPRQATAAYARDPAYRVVEAPGELPPFPYGIAWHPRMDADPGHRWLRDIVRSAAAELPGVHP